MKIWELVFFKRESNVHIYCKFWSISTKYVFRVQNYHELSNGLWKIKAIHAHCKNNLHKLPSQKWIKVFCSYLVFFWREFLRNYVSPFQNMPMSKESRFSNLGICLLTPEKNRWAVKFERTFWVHIYFTLLFLLWKQIS